MKHLDRRLEKFKPLICNVIFPKFKIESEIHIIILIGHILSGRNQRGKNGIQQVFTGRHNVLKPVMPRQLTLKYVGTQHDELRGGSA